jgi:preprotein translocase subunit SecE
MVNRATKRLLAKQEAAAEREKKQARAVPGAPTAGPGRVPRVPGTPREPIYRRMRRFLKEVRQELRKVSWPSRTEVLTYTVVVLVSVTFVTLFVFGLDSVFSWALFELFSTS